MCLDYSDLIRLLKQLQASTQLESQTCVCVCVCVPELERSRLTLMRLNIQIVICYGGKLCLAARQYVIY